MAALLLARQELKLVLVNLQQTFSNQREVFGDKRVSFFFRIIQYCYLVCSTRTLALEYSALNKEGLADKLSVDRLQCIV
jgi:hypothetical protein